MNTAPVKEIDIEALMDFCRRITTMQTGGTIDIEKIEPDGGRERRAFTAMGRIGGRSCRGRRR